MLFLGNINAAIIVILWYTLFLLWPNLLYRYISHTLAFEHSRKKLFQ